MFGICHKKLPVYSNIGQLMIVAIKMKINVYCWVDADASDQIETRNENLKFNKTLKLDDIKSFYRMKYFQMFLPPKRAHFF